MSLGLCTTTQVCTPVPFAKSPMVVGTAIVRQMQCIRSVASSIRCSQNISRFSTGSSVEVRCNRCDAWDRSARVGTGHRLAHVAQPDHINKQDAGFPGAKTTFTTKLAFRREMDNFPA